MLPNAAFSQEKATWRNSSNAANKLLQKCRREAGKNLKETGKAPSGNFATAGSMTASCCNGYRSQFAQVSREMQLTDRRMKLRKDNGPK
jgi:hypothetical protein